MTRGGRKGSRKAPLVLVVDDFEDTRRLYTDYLRFAGFRVEAANDGAEAIAKATELSPDVVVMDLAMPNVDGWQATRELRRDPRTRDAYVLVVTGFSGDEDRREAFRSGCDGLLTKPILPAELVRRIVARLTTRMGHAAHAAARAAAAPAAPVAVAAEPRVLASMEIGRDSD